MSQAAPSRPIALATRGSKLALWQAHAARGLLVAAAPARPVELVVVESSGDRAQHLDLASFGRIGIFTAEVDDAVLDRRADVGVHSLKDVTTTLPRGLALAAVLARGPVEDVLVSRGGLRLADLPRGSRVATGSVRRIAMLKSARPDVETVPIRGNVDTRLAKLESGAADALVMARAGLVRLGLERAIGEVLDLERFPPAAGQGIVALVCRSDDGETARALAGVGDREAYAEALAERALLAGLHGGCNAPLGVLARAREQGIALHACVLSLDGAQRLEDRLSGPIEDAPALGAELAERLAARGARELIEAARSR